MPRFVWVVGESGTLDVSSVSIAAVSMNAGHSRFLIECSWLDDYKLLLLR
jgi:hypothetical protein